jgi:CRP-like cAMP-binding protein
VARRKTKRHAPRDWAALRAAYRRGEGSLRELAKEHGIPASTVLKRAAAEKWEEQRTQVGITAEARAVERDVESVAAMLSKHRRFANRLLELAEKRLEEAVSGRKVSANLLQTLSDVLARTARQERLAAGIEPEKPVIGGSGEGPKTRVIVRGGANVPAAAALPPAPEQPLLLGKAS